uniref:Uncharacterized protein n=1 Tax=Arundo donax TaxID=35708 RepID=A0A0A8ZER3_ARUDO
MKRGIYCIFSAIDLHNPWLNFLLNGQQHSQWPFTSCQPVNA